MKLPFGISAGTVVGGILAFGLISQDVLARPSPEPKADWVRKAHGRKAMMDTLKGRSDRRRSLNLPRDPCPETAAKAITAPKKNVWGELADVDAAAVVAFLFAQPELNLTLSENATEWDNTV